MADRQQSLFPTEPEPWQIDAAAMRLVATVILVEGPHGEFDYVVPAEVEEAPTEDHRFEVGCRVRVPFGRGNRKVVGYCVRLEHRPIGTRPLKAVASVLDRRSLLSPAMIRLTEWIADYYLCPWGQVLQAVVPSGVRKQAGTRKVTLLSVPEETLAQLGSGELKLPSKQQRRAIEFLARSSQPLTPSQLQQGAECSSAPIKSLREKGYVVAMEARVPQFQIDEPAPPARQQPLELNDDQQKALAAVVTALNASKHECLLIHGVTGSGKTEVYIQAVEETVRFGRQAIILVPEISLTPQTVERFRSRFERVAVLHSHQSPVERHWHWHRIAEGQVQVVVGARSAIFAPTPNLGLIVIDEEHENTFKQDTAPRYHAREVAIRRAKDENVPLVLGSATPSLESMHRAAVRQSAIGSRQGLREPLESSREPTARRTRHRPERSKSDQGTEDRGQGTGDRRQETAENDSICKPQAGDLSSEPKPPTCRPDLSEPYQLLEMPRRIYDRPMPAVRIVDLREARQDQPFRGVISRPLEQAMREALQDGGKIMLFLNRRGFSTHIQCPACGVVVACPDCDIPLTFHRRDTTALCHYCDHQIAAPNVCPSCQSQNIRYSGTGTQRLEAEVKARFPDAPCLRMDTDSMQRAGSHARALAAFRDGAARILLGTQMIAKGHDFPDVTLVGVINADTALHFPDFRAAERTFQLITQVAGRTGRGEAGGRVVVQTLSPDHIAVRAAARHDYRAFAAHELPHRQMLGYPPFGRIVRIVVRGPNENDAKRFAESVGQWLRSRIAEFSPRPNVLGPVPAQFAKLRGKYRFQLLLRGPDGELLRGITRTVMSDLKPPEEIQWIADVDPHDML